MSKQKVPLLIAFTPDYLVPAATCLSSVLKHSNKDDEYLVICLLTRDLPELYRNRLRLIDPDGRLDFVYINLEDRLHGVYVDPKYTIAASYRLLAPEILPEHDIVIYLDCDMIIRKNLAELFRNISLDNHHLAAVYESPLDFQLAYIEKIGCSDTGYFNSGFMVMNLEKMRQDDMSRKFIDGLKTDYLEFPDQDVLNMLCRHHTIGLSPVYNSIRTFFLPQYKKFFLQKYTGADWEAVQKYGNIHYTGGKPWNQFTVKFNEWWHYFEALPKEVKKDWTMNRKMYFFYKFHKNYAGKIIVGAMQKLYRRLK